MLPQSDAMKPELIQVKLILILRMLHKHGHLDEANVLCAHVEALPAPHKATLPDES